MNEVVRVRDDNIFLPQFNFEIVVQFESIFHELDLFSPTGSRWPC